jgi:hypothetical protein
VLPNAHDVPRSASLFRSLAERSNTGPTSGIEPLTSGNIRPEKRFSIAKSVESSLCGYSTKVRTPLKMGVKPPVQVMRVLAKTPDTVAVKVLSS